MYKQCATPVHFTCLDTYLDSWHTSTLGDLDILPFSIRSVWQTLVKMLTKKSIYYYESTFCVFDSMFISVLPRYTIDSIVSIKQTQLMLHLAPDIITFLIEVISD